MRGLHRSGGSEDGAIAVTTAIILTVLIALMAFVVDYGLVRTDVRESQTASDGASQAGVAVLGDGGTYQEACRAALDMLEVNLDITVPVGTCDPFAPGVFEDPLLSITCATRAASSLDATSTPAVVAPVYVEHVVGEYTIRVQMPVRDTDPQMTAQPADPEFDGDDPCKRIAVSVRRSRDLIFGSFAGGSGQASGFADAVSRYRIVTGSEDISSLIVLDPTGCGTLDVFSSNGRLLVENNGGRPGLITVDSTGVGCGNNKYVATTGGSGARLCAGVDPARIEELPPGSKNYQLVTPGFCESDPDTLRTPARNTDVSAADPYGKAASKSSIDSRNVEPIPTFDDPVTRRPADHEWNCRDATLNSATSGDYPQSSTGDEWLPLWETIPPCTNGRANNMDELAEDLAEGSAFAAGAGWVTRSGADCAVAPGDNRTIGDGTSNIYFNCPKLDVKGTLRINAKQYVVVRGWIDGTGADTDLSVNVNASGADNPRDTVLVIQGKGPGNPGYGLSIGSEAVANINRTAVYIHTGAVQVNADDMRWTAPEDRSYYPLDDPDFPGAADNCVEQVSFGSYSLPSPECFQKLAMWTNNTGDHRLRGGGELEVKGVFFAPYAGHQGTSSFTLAGDTGQRLEFAQFFTYKFKLTGGSLLSMRPDPNFNIFTDEPVLSLIR